MKLLQIILLIVFLASCSSKNEPGLPVITDSFSLEDLKEIELNLYEVKSELEPLLDSIIFQSSNCGKYKNHPLGFVFESYRDSSGIFQIHLSSLVELEKMNYERCSGIFYHKGYSFAYIGDILEKCFKSLKDKRKIFFVAPEKMESIDYKYGEFFDSSWDFIYKEGKFICYHYNNCGEIWYEESFYHGEE